MTVELAPITDADIVNVADFLRANMKNPKATWARSCVPPWRVDAPNHGFMLRSGQRVVGVQLAFYSERRVAGCVERFCNLGAWCVLPEYRFHSIRLVMAVLAQDGYHFTAFTPMDRTRAILSRFKFRPLNTSAALVPNLPWPTLPGRARISDEPIVIEGTLEGAELELYHDHAQALAVHHHVVICGWDSCYVMYREVRSMGLPCAVLVHVSNPDLFHHALPALTRHLLLRHRLVATLGELQIIGHRPRLSVKLNALTKMYRSASLEAGQIDYLYSELACVPYSGTGLSLAKRPRSLARRLPPSRP
jgi:hypothetical protein